MPQAPRPEILTVAGGPDLAEAAAGIFAETARESIAERGVFTVALSGGSTPRALFQLLATEPWRGRVDWPRLSVFWGDERTVPPESPESNFGMARETLLNKVPIPAEQIHRMKGELDPEVAATEYEEELRRVFALGHEPRLPVFDLQLLGIGPDGHTASLFPGTPAVFVEGRLCVANPVPQQQTIRLTLTPPVINASATILVLASGPEKADAVARAIEGPEDFSTTPSQILRRAQGRVIWLLDKAAAAKLTG